MGTCVSNHEELLKELKKHDNNQIILEHLRQNQETFAAITRSLNQIATLNRSEPNLSLTALTSPKASRSTYQYHENPCCSLRKFDNSKHQKSLLLVPKKFINQQNNLSDTSNGTDSIKNEDYQKHNLNYKSNHNSKYPESILVDSNFKKHAYHYHQSDLNLQPKHFKYTHLTNPSRHCKSPQLILIDTDTSTSLSSSYESLHSNKKLYNERKYYDNRHNHNKSLLSKHKNQTAVHQSLQSPQIRVNDIPNNSFKCNKTSCNRSIYAMHLNESRSDNNEKSPGMNKNYKYSEINHSNNKQRNVYKKRSQSSSKPSSASNTFTKKSVNFLNTEYDSHDNSGSLTFDEADASKWNEPSKINSLAVYDNLSEFNKYLNEKIMARQAKRLEKSPFFNGKNAQDSTLYSDNSFNSNSKEFSILPIRIEPAIYQQRVPIKEAKLSDEPIIKYIDSKLDLSFSSNDRPQNSTLSVSLETSLNLVSLNQNSDSDIDNKENSSEVLISNSQTNRLELEDGEDLKSITTITKKNSPDLNLIHKDVKDEEGSSHQGADEKGYVKENAIEVSNEPLERCHKLKIKNIVDAVGFVMFPSSGFINKAFRNLLVENCLFELFKKTFKKEFQALFDSDQIEGHKYSVPADDLINISLVHLLEINSKTEVGTDTRKLLKEFQVNIGRQYFKILYEEYKNALLSIGDCLQSFFNNLNSLNDSLINHEKFGPRFFHLSQKYTGYLPSFRCDDEILKKVNKKNTYMLKIYTIQQKTTPFMSNFYLGLIEEAAKLLMNLDVRVEKFKKTDLTLSFMEFDLINTESESDLEFMQHILGYKITLLSEAQNQVNSFLTNSTINCSEDLCISIDLFKSTFPFSLLLDRKLDIIQFGDSLIKHLGHSILAGHGSHFLTYFDIELPKLNEYSFESIIINKNMNYRLKMRMVDDRNNELKDMELKGSMIYVDETDCLLFIGSPVLLGLDELTGRGLYISDIPIHDATRDIILVGEQTKAQDGLKTRMEKLQTSVRQAYEEIEEEKRKNIELLNLIFPSDVAEKLWNGEKIICQSIENVTLLYSDIVGFTAICGTAQPIQIVEMLKRLYTEFDHACGLLDIYKLETIGDAYIVAGGLHKKSKYHAQRIGWMSLLMMDSAANNYTHKGDRIKIRIGLHTGDVLAGIVGIKQPRYCLFGNNCNIANKFESASEEKRIHISATTKRFLDETSGFEVESRGSDFVPDNYVSESGSEEKLESWFLNSYKFKGIKDDDTLMNHIKAGLQNLNEA